MSRYARMVISEEKAVYHVMSLTALPEYPFGDAEKDEFVKIIKRFNTIYFSEIYGFSIMGNHIHLLICMYPDRYFTDADIRKRFELVFPSTMGKYYSTFDETWRRILKKKPVSLSGSTTSDIPTSAILHPRGR